MPAVFAPASIVTAPPIELEGLLGQSAAILALKQQIVRVAPTTATVLICGESGTGKEVVACALHALSGVARGPLITVNCGAMAPTLIESELLGHERGSFTGAAHRRAGYFEAAEGGTLFLDEITEMPPAMQVKLLRVLEYRQFHRVGGSELVTVNVRVIAACNRDVAQAAREGQFRADLMYRLAAFPLAVPPLRVRGDDVLLLAHHFLDALNRHEGGHKRFSSSSLHRLTAHDWPGNVRELKNTVSRAFILADTVLDVPPLARPARLPPSNSAGQVRLNIGTSLQASQKALVLATITHCQGDKPQAARMLGLSLKTLYNRLDSYSDKTAH
ncbi:MAG: sigma-54 dependent transcriptional regulator [Pseudomonadota bacterium]